jgi:HlyD family secretion protein
LSIDSYPANDFGTLQGTVGLISSDALPPDRSKGQATYLFPTTVNLSKQRLPLKNGVSLPLQAGMSVNANIRLRQVTYLQLLLGSFRDKASSIRRL